MERSNRVLGVTSAPLTCYGQAVMRRRALRDPAVENSDQPVGGLGACAGCADRRMIPGRVRQQKVNPGRMQIHWRLIDHQRIVGNVDRAGQARIQIPETGTGQQPDAADHLVVAAAPVRVPAMAVIGGPVTIDGDAG